MNLTEQPEFETAYFEVADQHVSHYTTETHLFILDKNTWYHIAECQLFTLKIVTWSCNCLQRIIIIIIYSLEFFTSVLADGSSLEFEWQQISSSLQDSSQYSGWSQ